MSEIWQAAKHAISSNQSGLVGRFIRATSSAKGGQQYGLDLDLQD